MYAPMLPTRCLLVAALSLLWMPPGVRAEEPAPQAPEAPPEVAPPAPVRLPLVLLGGFKGEFGLPDCRAEGGPTLQHSDYARLVGRVAQLTEEATADSGNRPIVLHTGDLHFPGALPRHLVEEDGLDELFGLMERVPYDGVALGGLDLSLPVDRVSPYFATAQERGFPLLAANLACAADAPRPEVCSALRPAGADTPFRVVERGGVRVALLSVLDPGHADEISAEKRRGLTLQAFEAAVTPAVARIRGEDLADLVVVLHHSQGRSQELALLGALPALEGIDLVVSKQLKNGLWGKREATPEGADLGWSVVPGSGTVVVSAGRGVSQAVLAEVEALPSDGGWSLRPLRTSLFDVSGSEADADTLASLDAMGATYCADWGGAVQPEVSLAGPMDLAGFQRFTLDAMRDEARTELALLNAGALRNTDLLPVSDHLTRADLHALLPFGGTLVKGRIPGDQLWFFGPDALVGGLERVDGTPRVNGRPIDVTRTYSVVMNRFVADGGDSILPDGYLKKRADVLGQDGAPLEVVGLLDRSLKEKRFVSRRTGQLDPARKHVDLHQKPAFRFSGYLNASYSKVAVDNPEHQGAPAYDQGELLTFAADKFQGDARISMSAKSRDHELGTSAYLLYSFARFEDEFGGLLETGDWIRGRINYDFVGLRSRAKDNGFVPVPFVEGQLGSEFDRPATRDWHRLELTAIGGAKIRPLRPLTIKVGLNVRREVFDPEAETLPGLYVGYTLERTTLFQIKSNPVELESETSWFYNDIARTDIHEIRHGTRLYVELFSKLYFTTSVAAYAYREGPVDAWGAYLDVTLGVSFGSASAVQSL